MYTTIRFVLQESGILLGDCLTCEELVVLLTGDDGVVFIKLVFLKELGKQGLR